MSDPSPAQRSGKGPGDGLSPAAFEAEVVAILLQHLDRQGTPGQPAGDRLAPSAGKPELAQDLARFCGALRAANEHINLTGITDPEGMALRHVMDSLLALPFLDGGGPLADVGSGGGVPGIPLAMALPERPVVCIESRERKAAALGQLVETLGLGPRVQAVRARAELWLADHAVDTVVTRALGSVDNQLKLFGRVRGSFRRLVMLKGPAADDELEAASKTRHREGYPDPQRHEIQLPGDAGDRVVLVFDGDG